MEDLFASVISLSSEFLSLFFEGRQMLGVHAEPDIQGQFNEPGILARHHYNLKAERRWRAPR
jgi:hypothetical protein